MILICKGRHTILFIYFVKSNRILEKTPKEWHVMLYSAILRSISKIIQKASLWSTSFQEGFIIRYPSPPFAFVCNARILFGVGAVGGNDKYLGLLIDKKDRWQDLKTIAESNYTRISTLTRDVFLPNLFGKTTINYLPFVRCFRSSPTVERLDRVCL